MTRKIIRKMAVCDDCDFKTYGFITNIAQEFAEQHMMKTGHTVQIKEE